MWLTAATPDCVVALSSTPCAEVNPGSPIEAFTLIENLLDTVQGSIGPSGDATLVRLVGEIHLSLNFAAGAAADSSQGILTQTMGIYLGDINAQNQILQLDPLFFIQSKDWLWTGSFSAQATVIAGGSILTTVTNQQGATGTNANGSHIDIKVKRKVRKGEGIFLATKGLSQNIFGTSIAFATFMTARLRALILLP